MNIVEEGLGNEPVYGIFKTESQIIIYSKD